MLFHLVVFFVPPYLSIIWKFMNFLIIATMFSLIVMISPNKLGSEFHSQKSIERTHTTNDPEILQKERDKFFVKK